MPRAHHTTFAAVCLLAAVSVGPTAAATDDERLFEAIRLGDTGTATALLASGASLDARDAGGATALMRAVVYLSANSLASLLRRGGDVNVSNTRGATPLMWAAHDTEKIRLLLGRGANPNARASDGSTALLAAARFGNVGAMRLLLNRGADPRASANGALDLLRVAYLFSNDPAMRQLLKQQGIRLTSARDVPGALAANVTHLQTTVDLLSSGADPNERIGPLELPAIAIAAHAGATEAVARLLAHGADPNARASGGLTALMVAAAANRSTPAAVRTLLDRGADPLARDDAGRTALDWALMRGETKVASELRQVGAPTATSTKAAVPGPRSARAAIEAALTRLQPSGPAFYDGAKCVSCHHQSLPAMAVTLAAHRGVPVDNLLASHAATVTINQWRAQEDQLFLGGGGIGLFASATYGLVAFAEEGVPANPAIDAAVIRLAAYQERNGSWDMGNNLRPPLDGSPISRTALAIRGLSVYAPPGRRAEMMARIARSRRFLQMATPLDTHDEAFKLLGLVWSGAAASDIARQRARLRALQRPDGGWGQWPQMAPDAFATGLALYALHTSGFPAHGAAYRAGADYLLRTQLEDGTWRVRSRAIGFQPYFETGFPHGRDQFISAAATSWAAIALAYTLTP
jgi:ankyrin repeat protein